MKRLWRWLFNFAAVVSLLLLAATLWIGLRPRPSSVAIVTSPSTPERSFTLEGIGLENGRFVAFLEDANGRLITKRTNDPIANGKVTEITPDGIVYDAGTSVHIAAQSNLAGEYVPVTGASMSRPNATPTNGTRPILNHFVIDSNHRLVVRLYGLTLRVPYWLLLLGTSVIPTLWCILFRRRGNQPGHCHICGYDLRATPGRCPECGAISDAAKRVAT